jgi:CHAT domain-containing protein
VVTAAIVLVDTDVRGALRPSPPTTANERVALIDAAPRVGAQALPGAVREVAALDSVWRGRAFRIDAAKGAAHTLSRIGRATIVHFAGHAVLDRVRPERGYLALPASPDSMIHGAALTQKSFGHVRLVILAACETRGVAAGSSSGFESLAGALLTAGVASVIGATWTVDDAVSATLMTWVHDGLRAGARPEQALRMAQLAALRADARALTSPRVWAGFQTIGR